MTTAPATTATPTSSSWLRVRRVDGPPVVALRLWLWGGSRCERTPGLAWVTGRMLSEGTRSRGWRAISEACESLGMVLSSFGGLEAHGIGADCMARDWRTAVEWMAELLLEPSFPADRCAWQGTQGIAELESLRDEPDTKTAWAYAEQLYAPHAAGRPMPGDAASLRRIDPELCRAFHQEALARGGVFTVAGDVDEDEVSSAVAGLLDLARPGSGTPDPVAPVRGLASSRREVATIARDQAHLFMGHLTVPRTHPDLAALEVGSVILGAGAGLTGRIPQRIREREGLAYSAGASIVAGAGLDAGRFIVHVGTSPDTVARAEAAVREELERLLQGGVTDVEFEEARTYLLRREPFRRETPQQWVDLLAQSVLYGLPYDDPEWVKNGYRALDRAGVEAALRRHLRSEDLRVTVGLPGADDEDDDDDGCPAGGDPEPIDDPGDEDAGEDGGVG